MIVFIDRLLEFDRTRLNAAGHTALRQTIELGYASDWWRMVVMLGGPRCTGYLSTATEQ
jgi:hypothetical protein